ncbi:MAG: GyrI-like domain-containing protein [Prosthecobacter sp.]|uniref:GyrI-like domain-containing protein n=1 Tax=Prosthecobacter sp. TaxID=1965333 RepID=UPI0025E3D32F|nr:GyrI-like domain-containing protein [Prosthecobacter sp.]MCF7786564.1 GyrI-like domain-containing protein [Prosthecobacter sp.]
MLDQPTSPIVTEAQIAAVIHITVPRDQIQQVMGPAIQEVIAAATAQGIGPKGPVFAHLFGMTPGIFNFEVGVPVSSAVQPVGRVKPGEIPGTTIVRTVYTGPYEGLGEAWGDFQDIIESQGHKLGPNLWERYLSGPESSDESATFRTELNQTIITP